MKIILTSLVFLLCNVSPLLPFNTMTESNTRVSLSSRIPPSVQESFHILVDANGGMGVRPAHFPHPTDPTWTKDRNLYNVVLYYSPDGCTIRFITASILANGMLITYATEDVRPCDPLGI